MSSTTEHRPLRVESRKVEKLVPYERNSKIHDKKQVKQIAASIQEFGFNVPVLIDGQNRIIAGHGRVLAAKQLEMKEVPTIAIDHLTDAQRRAFIIADNKLTENSSWNTEMLALEFKELGMLDLSFDLEITGFDTSEMDLILLDENKAPTDADVMPDIDEDMPTNCKAGDIWQLGDHRLICGDSTKSEIYERLLGEQRADLVNVDPPYNVPVDGYISGWGKQKHSEFAMATGEMTDDEFLTFLGETFKNLATYSRSGSIHYVFIDWKHVYDVITAGRQHYTEFKNLCVWNKDNAGMGAFYRNKHELICVFKNGSTPHINNFELGQHGRARSNVWDYPAVRTFFKDSETGERRDGLMKLHPTPRPVAMLMDIFLDCSKRGDIVMEPFIGSGTAVLAAEKTGRCCYGIDMEPHYIDLAIRRWQNLTGKLATHAETGQSFNA
jgi:DNA modification methylase